MSKTYDPIQTTTLGATTTTVTFQSISQAFTDLVLVANFARVTLGGQACNLRLNNDTGSNYSNTRLVGDGSSALSGRTSNMTSMFMTPDLNSSTSDLVTVIFQFMNYSNTTTNKTVLDRSNQAGVFTGAFVGLWRNTAAIDRIDISSFASGQFGAGSTFTLYGIKAE